MPINPSFPTSRPRLIIVRGRLLRSARAGKPRKSRSYSVGQINKLVDDFVHPFYRKSELYRVADGLLHGLIERGPRISVKKFLKYNLPEIVKKLLERI